MHSRLYTHTHYYVPSGWIVSSCFVKTSCHLFSHTFSIGKALMSHLTWRVIYCIYRLSGSHWSTLRQGSHIGCQRWPCSCGWTTILTVQFSLSAGFSCHVIFFVQLLLTNWLLLSHLMCFIACYCLLFDSYLLTHWRRCHQPTVQVNWANCGSILSGS